MSRLFGEAYMPEQLQLGGVSVTEAVSGQVFLNNLWRGIEVFNNSASNKHINMAELEERASEVPEIMRCSFDQCDQNGYLSVAVLGLLSLKNNYDDLRHVMGNPYFKRNNPKQPVDGLYRDAKINALSAVNLVDVLGGDGTGAVAVVDRSTALAVTLETATNSQQKKMLDHPTRESIRFVSAEIKKRFRSMAEDYDTSFRHVWDGFDGNDIDESYARVADDFIDISWSLRLDIDDSVKEVVSTARRQGRRGRKPNDPEARIYVPIENVRFENQQHGFIVKYNL